MAKNKKKLASLSIGDLTKRKDKTKKQIAALKEKARNTSDPEKKKEIKQQIEQKDISRKKIKKNIDKKRYKNPKGTRGEQLDRIYNSPAFTTLSPANQQLIRGVVDSYDTDKLQSTRLSPKRIAAIEADARQAAKKIYKGSKKEFDQDYEEALHANTVTLERLIAEQTKRLQEDIRGKDNLNADRRIAAIENMKTALAESKARYEVESKRKNEYLAEQLGFVRDELNKQTSRADEDKIMQLRALERSYKKNLRSVQDNMAQRGLAFSGIRIQEENELGEEYEDNRTTAEIERDRRIEDAQKQAEERDAGLDVTRSEIEDLLFTYGVDQRNAVRSTESIIGTSETQDVISSGQYGIQGGNPNDYLYKGMRGSLNIEDDERRRAYQDSINANLEAYEQKYGTKLLKENLSGSMKATEDYKGYTPIGKLSGTTTTAYNRDIEQLKDDRSYNRKKMESAGRDKALTTKFMGLI